MWILIELSSKETGDVAEIEAASFLRVAFDRKFLVSMGNGKTIEGSDAPDIIIHFEEHTSQDESGITRINNTTKTAHAILTKNRNYWGFTCITHSDVHPSIRKWSPEITTGVTMRVRKRPQGIPKDPTKSNFGYANIPHSVNFKPTTTNSVSYEVFRIGNELTTAALNIIKAIEKHVEEYGPFVIEIKVGSGSQLSNFVYHATRPENNSKELSVSFENTTLPEQSQIKMSEMIVKNAGQYIHNYMDEISTLSGKDINTTRLRKVRNKMEVNGKVYRIESKDKLDIPEPITKKVKFFHAIGNEADATLGLRLSFDRHATNYVLEKVNKK